MTSKLDDWAAEFIGRKSPIAEPPYFPTIEEDIAIGKRSGYPECCIKYYIESRLNPDLPRWLHPKKSYLLCPKHAKELGGKPTYTWREAVKFHMQANVEYSLRELQTMAKEHGISFSGLKKPDLLDKLVKAGFIK